MTLSPQTRNILAQWITKTDKQQDDLLFTRLKGNLKAGITTHHYRRLLKKWVVWAQLDCTQYSTHSARRTKAALIYRQTLNIEVVRQLLGHKSVAATSLYLNVGQQEALDIAKKIDI